MRKYSSKEIFARVSLDEFIKYYITENHTFYETLEHFNFHSDYFLQEYIKQNNLSKQNTHYDKIKFSINKEILYQYYIIENHSIKECAKYFNSTLHAIKILIKEYQIQKEQKDVIKIGKKTKLERYGNENYNNIEKGLETKLQRYGREYDSSNEKRKITLIDKYGSLENAYQLSSEKSKQTCLEKYGVDNIFKSDIFRDKISETFLNKYGTIHYTQSEDFKSKSKQTCLQKYGVENYSQSSQAKEKHNKTYQEKVAKGISLYDYCIHNKRYTYKDKKFDSSWELALYIYLKDHNIVFEYQPNISFEYTYNNFKHWYYPDFKIGEDIVEIKSDYLFRRMSDKFYSNYSELENSKYTIMVANNVKILLYEDIKPYIDYVEKTYGKGYLQLFRNKGAY